MLRRAGAVIRLVVSNVMDPLTRDATRLIRVELKWNIEAESIENFRLAAQPSVRLAAGDRELCCNGAVCVLVDAPAGSVSEVCGCGDRI